MLKNIIRRGFTLVEMIVVLVIVAILGAIAIAGYQKVVEKAEEKAAETTLQTIDREYRALDAFNLGTTDPQGVLLTDLQADSPMASTGVAGVEFNDVDGDGMIEVDDTVKYVDSEGDQVGRTLKFGSATVAGVWAP